jgi:hypothetical protein
VFEFPGFKITLMAKSSISNRNTKIPAAKLFLAVISDVSIFHLSFAIANDRWKMKESGIGIEPYEQ